MRQSKPVAAVEEGISKSHTEKKRKLNRTEGDRSFKDVDIISVALKSGGFSEEDLVVQTMAFLAAGHETNRLDS